MEEGLKKLKNLIRHPDDINEKIEQIMIKQKKENLKTKNDYNDTLQQILYNLNLNQSKIKDILKLKKEYEGEVEQTSNILTSLKDYIQNYKKIESIAIIHRNFKKVRDLNEKLVNLENDVRKYLEVQKTEQGDVIDSFFTFDIFIEKDLLEMHKEIFNFEEFKYELVYYSQEIDRECFLMVQRKINLIDKVLIDFLVAFLKIGTNFIELFKREHIKNEVEIIIMLEEERDALTRKVKQGKGSSDIVMNEIYNMNYRYLERDEKNLKERFMEAMRDCIRNKVYEFRRENFAINNMNTVFDDLDCIAQYYNQDHKENHDNEKDSANHETAKKKKNMKVIDWFSIIIAYNDELRKFLNEKYFNTGEILYILKFTDSFYTSINTLFKIPKESLGEPLLHDKEEAYLNEYMRQASLSLGSWIDTIKNNEIEKFYRRDVPPIVDEENKYVSENFITFLSIIKQQLEPISFHQKIFTFITNEIIKFSKSFAKEISRAMERDLNTSCKQKGQPGYEEYVIMMGNSGIKIAQYVSSLPQSQNSEIKDLGNIFIDITKKANQLLSLFVLNTCKPATDKIFTDEWYNEDVTNILLVTLEDFLSDYSLTMSGFTFITFIYELINELMKAYLNQLKRNRAKIYEDCGYKLQKDYEKIFVLFSNYGDEEEIASHLEIFKKIIPLLGRTSEEIFMIDLKALLGVYPDIKRDYIKNIVLKKDELSNSEKKTYLEKIKECFSEIRSDRKTLFSTLIQ